MANERPESPEWIDDGRLRITDVRVPPLSHRPAPFKSGVKDKDIARRLPEFGKFITEREAGKTPEKKPERQSFLSCVGDALAAAAGVVGGDAARDASPGGAKKKPDPPAEPQGYVFVPKKGEAPAEALRRKMFEKRKWDAEQAALAAERSALGVHDTRLDSPDSSGQKGAQDTLMDDWELEVQDHFRPNIFFQNARYSGFAPSPESLPRHHQLPAHIYFYIRLTDVAAPSLTRPLPEHFVSFIQEAKTIRGQEAAGPLARIDFNAANVVGLASRLDAIIAGLSQLVIDVPSQEAYPGQDPRVQPFSFTFQPYHQSSLHGEWLPRINVPVRADRPRPSSPEALRQSSVVEKPKLKLKTVEYDEGPPSPTQVGNPFAEATQRTSRSALASERRTREAARRLEKINAQKEAAAAKAPLRRPMQASPRCARRATRSVRCRRWGAGRATIRSKHSRR